MDIELFFNKMVSELDLGSIIEGPVQVYGGLMHRMFKIITSKGNYIVKLLNPNVMKRETALGNFKKSDELEEILKDNNIDAVYSIKFNNSKLQLLDGQYYYVYEWYDGVSLKDKDIKKIHCEKIGNVLASIHNISLRKEKWVEEKKNINWNYYINLAKEKNSIIYDMIYDKLDLLNNSMLNGNKVVDKLPNYAAICHNDLDSKNVLWSNNNFKIIDLECLGYSNPYLELFSLALCWSGYESCNIDYDLFLAFINSYFNNSVLSKDIDWESLYYANNGRLEWLEYNIKRALMIESSSNEEMELGIKEVKETIEHIVYYDLVKDKILNICRSI